MTDVYSHNGPNQQQQQSGGNGSGDRRYGRRHVALIRDISTSIPNEMFELCEDRASRMASEI